LCCLSSSDLRLLLYHLVSSTFLKLPCQFITNSHFTCTGSTSQYTRYLPPLVLVSLSNVWWCLQRWATIPL
jgi:hypothetical protein